MGYVKTIDGEVHKVLEGLSEMHDIFDQCRGTTIVLNVIEQKLDGYEVHDSTPKEQIFIIRNIVRLYF